MVRRPAVIPRPGLTLNGQNIPMHGLYGGDFVGYKIASSAELDTALREAVVTVDAGVLCRALAKVQVALARVESTRMT
jgi:hypothetical protein